MGPVVVWGQWEVPPWLGAVISWVLPLRFVHTCGCGAVQFGVMGGAGGVGALWRGAVWFGYRGAGGGCVGPRTDVSFTLGKQNQALRLATSLGCFLPLCRAGSEGAGTSSSRQGECEGGEGEGGEGGVCVRGVRVRRGKGREGREGREGCVSSVSAGRASVSRVSASRVSVGRAGSLAPLGRGWRGAGLGGELGTRVGEAWRGTTGRSGQEGRHVGGDTRMERGAGRSWHGFAGETEGKASPAWGCRWGLGALPGLRRGECGLGWEPGVWEVGG